MGVGEGRGVSYGLLELCVCVLFVLGDGEGRGVGCVMCGVNVLMLLRCLSAYLGLLALLLYR